MIPITEVAPIGTRTTEALYDGTRNGERFGGHGPIEIPTYPISLEGKRLQELREAAGLTPSELAKLAGVVSLDIYRLENGSATATAEGWAELMTVIGNHDSKPGIDERPPLLPWSPWEIEE
jgi:DNA-binding XRE family transcriptional regulator